jgi:hypothetical protein
VPLFLYGEALGGIAALQLALRPGSQLELRGLVVASAPLRLPASAMPPPSIALIVTLASYVWPR